MDIQFTKKIRKLILFLNKEYIPKYGEGLKFP